MKTSNIINFIVGFLFIAAFSFAVIAKEPGAAMVDAGSKTNMQKNMTFGQCVSQAADVKNSCFKSAQDSLAACKSSAGKQADSKPALKQCDSDYKKGKDQCKSSFKTAKKECGKIKHNFIDSLKASFK